MSELALELVNPPMSKVKREKIAKTLNVHNNDEVMSPLVVQEAKRIELKNKKESDAFEKMVKGMKKSGLIPKNADKLHTFPAKVKAALAA